MSGKLRRPTRPAYPFALQSGAHGSDPDTLLRGVGGRPPGRRGPVMAKIGYARVSTRGQNDDSQVDDLTAYGCEKIFTDTASGKNAARPELDKALAYLRAGPPG